MYEILLVIFSLIAISLVALIILQKGKSINDIGAAFGSGVSSTLFGSVGSSNFITHMTTILAILFFILSLLLGNLSSRHNKKDIQWNVLHESHKPEIMSKDMSTQQNHDIPQ